MSKFKILLEEKIESDRLLSSWDRDKSWALYNELIWLGEQLEKQQQSHG